MPVKIRLMRIGAKKRPFYRVVAVDERAKRTGGYIELLGTYNPLTNPKEIILKQDKIDEWIKKGAVMSDGFLRIIGKAPQRPARKPKKEKKEEPAAAPAPTEQADKSEAETGESSQLSEAGEVSTESTSPDVHEADQTGSEQSEKAELENRDQASEPTTETTETPVEEETK